MVFYKEGNREFLQCLKSLVRRDREAGEYVPPSFDNILQSLDEMSAKNDDAFLSTSEDVAVFTTYSPGRKEYEILQAYNSLVEAGGRPVCPLGDTNNVSKDPERYLEILVPWLGGSTSDDGLDWKGIFQQQLSNWQQFRAWQRANRYVPPSHSHGRQNPAAGDTHDAASRSGGGPGSNFEVHIESIKERLRHWGFTKSFCFNNDMDRQDDWTTWIEYMGFECYCFDYCCRRLDAESLENLQIAMGFRYPASSAQSAQSLSHVSFSGSESRTTGTPLSRRQLDDCGSVMPSTITVGAQNSHRNRRTDDCFKDDSTMTEMEDPSDAEDASRSGSERDGAAGKSPKLNDAEHHNLILRWAFLQEPEIAAMCFRQSAIESVHETAILESGLRQLKRHRDGSMRESKRAVRLGHLDMEEVPNDEINELGPKRCRSDGIADH